MKTTILCFGLLLGGSATAQEHALDGRTYLIKYGEKGGSQSTKDTLMFRGGRFRSTGCDAYGFGDASYLSPDAGRFSAETESAKEGRIRWQGALRGDEVEGTFVWSKPGKAPVEYAFKGRATAATPPKGFDKKGARKHLLEHQQYPASRAELVASCNKLMDFSADDKKWFSESLPERSYASADEVMAALGLK